MFTNYSPLNGVNPYGDVSSVANALAGGQYVVLVDDFTSSGSNAAITTATGLTFENAWNAVQISGGTQAASVLTGTYANPGIVRMTTSAAAGQGLSLYRGGGSNNATPLGIIGANAGWQFDVWFSTGSTITDYAFRIGFCATTQQAADAPTNGFWIEYDTANASSNSTMQLRNVTTSVSTYSNTAVTPAASTFYHFRMRGLASGSVAHQIGTAGGALSAATTFTVNNANAMMPFIQVIARTTSARSLDVDRYSYIAPSARG